MKETKPTYEEFEAAVWEIFSDLIDTDATDSEKRKFFEASEQKEHIKYRYERNAEDFDSCKLSRLIFLGDGVQRRVLPLYAVLTV